MVQMQFIRIHVSFLDVWFISWPSLVINDLSSSLYSYCKFSSWADCKEYVD